MILFSAIFTHSGKAHRITLNAANAVEAQTLATALGCGLEEEAKIVSTDHAAPVTPEAYDEKTARHMLGGISRTSLYRLIVRGKLERVKGTRKVLVTRRSIERFCA
jgi:hypothetical protein